MGLGLAASLFWGCQDLLSQNDKSTPATDAGVTTDESALRLSIKDDSTCRDQWGVILAARSNGHADSVAEAAFLAGCVKEVKVVKDKTPPVIPPNLVPDSLSRCHWIVSQIDGGRNEMTVSYKRYCPEDCRKLEVGDSTRHDKLCREPGDKDTIDHPIKPPVDTTVRPPHPDTGDCGAFRVKLSMVKPGEPGRAELEKMYFSRCHDTLPKPPMDTIVKPPMPKDTLPKPPVPVIPKVNCDELLAKLAKLDVSSADYARIKASLAVNCPEKKP